MQENYPHEIRRFSDGEAIPEGSIPLTEEQFKILDPMTPEERGKWVQEHGMETVLDHLRRGGFVEEKGDPDRQEIAEALDRRRVEERERRELDKKKRERSPLPQPPPAKRQHRHQGR